MDAMHRTLPTFQWPNSPRNDAASNMWDMSVTRDVSQPEMFLLNDEPMNMPHIVFTADVSHWEISPQKTE